MIFQNHLDLTIRIRFTSPLPSIESPKVVSEMNDIRVVPNPYVVGHRFESPLPPGITSGRGSRKVEFQNLPSDGMVHIFSSRGQHIRTLNHSGNMFSGTIAWDLKSKENLDIAFGVYYYIVESKIGGKTSGKLAMIKMKKALIIMTILTAAAVCQSKLEVQQLLF